MNNDDQPINIDSDGTPVPPKNKPPLHHKLRFLDPRRKWSTLSKKHKIIVVAVALLVILVGGLIAHNLSSNKSEPVISINKNAKKAPTTVASPLSGLQVAPDLAKRPVTGIMIENSLDSRPQSGVQDAGVIFEAIAEGGITRFLTLYQDARPQYIGPVRSLRPYYIDWAGSFDASIAHVGGSPDALSQIRSGGKDLDEFFNAGSYWRENSRVAPHNVYTDFDKMDALNNTKGYTSSNFQPWPRKADQKLATPTVKTIDIGISSYNFNVHYEYNADCNCYLRSEGGQHHIVTTSSGDTAGQQLHPKVVIAMVTSYGINPDGQHSDYTTTGSGTVLVFQDGGVTVGAWSKADRTSRLDFKDQSGQNLIKLNAGQVWITAEQADQTHYQ